MQLDDNASGGVLEAEADGEVKGERAVALGWGIWANF